MSQRATSQSGVPDEVPDRTPDPSPAAGGQGEAADLGADPEDQAELVVPAAALQAVERERDDALAQWKRAAADYQNLRRRSLSDQESAVRRALEPLLGEILLALDNLDLALAAAPVPDAGDAAGLHAGVRLTREQIVRALDALEVRPLAADPGQAFDPARHQAVSQVASGAADARAPGTIHDILRRGWTWRGAVLRPAQVRVVGMPQASAGGTPKAHDEPGREAAGDDAAEPA